MSGRIVLSLALTSLALFAFGCGEDEVPLEPEVPVNPYPANSTPEGAIRRFISTYEARDTSEFLKLFTSDFEFQFSNSTDPDLVNKFSAGWFKDDEIISSRNLFVGGVNSGGEFQPAAVSIDLNLGNTSPGPITFRGQDTLLHQRLFTSLNLTIQLPPSQFDPEGTTFVVGGVDPAAHEFFFVRGDAAELESDQATDSLHWYINRWADVSTINATFDFPNQASYKPGAIEGDSWGRIKGLYR
jgi:hypothetical protein